MFHLKNNNNTNNDTIAPSNIRVVLKHAWSMIQQSDNRSNPFGLLGLLAEDSAYAEKTRNKYVFY